MTKLKLPENMRVYVGVKDKKGAVRQDPCNCPLARAIKRRFPSTYSVQVYKDNLVKISSKTKERLYKYSEIVRKNISAFDNKRKAFKVGHIRLHTV